MKTKFLKSTTKQTVKDPNDQEVNSALREIVSQYPGIAAGRALTAATEVACHRRKSSRPLRMLLRKAVFSQAAAVLKADSALKAAAADLPDFVGFLVDDWSKPLDEKRTEAVFKLIKTLGKSLKFTTGIKKA